MKNDNEKIIELESQLKERDNELGLAAQYGQQLLKENQLLEKKLSRLQLKQAKNKSSSGASNTSILPTSFNFTNLRQSGKKNASKDKETPEYISLLESQVLALQQKISSLEHELKQLIKTRKQQVKEWEAINSELNARFLKEERDKNEQIIICNSLAKQNSALKKHFELANQSIKKNSEPSVISRNITPKPIAEDKQEETKIQDVKQQTQLERLPDSDKSIQSLFETSPHYIHTHFEILEPASKPNPKEQQHHIYYDLKDADTEDDVSFFVQSFRDDDFGKPTFYTGSNSPVKSKQSTPVVLSSQNKTNTVIKTLFFHWFDNLYHMLPMSKSSQEYATWTTKQLLYPSLAFLSKHKQHSNT